MGWTDKPGWNGRAVWRMALAVLAGGWLTGPIQAQVPPINQVWAYRFLHDGAALDDCPICDRLSVWVPATGRFDLLTTSTGPGWAELQLSNVVVTAEFMGPAPATFRGGGRARWVEGGRLEDLRLDLRRDEDPQVYVFVPDALAPPYDPVWPVFRVSLIETQQATMVQVYHLNLQAAPFRELWFSTVHGMTPGSVPEPGAPLTGGDLLADPGRVVRTAAELMAGLQLEPAAALPGIDAADVLSGGEVTFSLSADVTASALGTIQQGDWVSVNGLRRRNQELVQAFGLQPPVADLGLDAVQLRPDGEVWFSLTGRAFSEWLGVTLTSGDLLSDQGRIVRAEREWLARFHPAEGTGAVGLDAVFVWPHGECWFSTETGFTDDVLGLIGPGDLLSDRGFLVFRNLELVRAFSPLEDLADFGLDALFVVSDLNASAVAPRVSVRLSGALPRLLELSWTGLGAVFQVERSNAVEGPYTAVSPLLPGSRWSESLPEAPGAARCYRLRQW